MAMVSMKPRVSVALPVWNAERYLADAIESILSQTLQDFELVIVDDGSADTSPDILSRYASRDPRVRVHRQANAGFVSAVNAAIDLCSAEYVARMDSDDIAEPDRLERQVCYLDSHPDVGLVAGSVVLIDEEGRDLRTLRVPESDARIRASLQATNPLCDPAVLMRKSALRRPGPYRRAFGAAADYDLWLRLSEQFRLGAVSEPVLRYRWHAGQLSNSGMQAQIVGLIGARYAARQRKAYGADPFDDEPDVTVDRLRGLGLDDTRLQSEILRETAARAGMLVAIGRPNQAEMLLDRAVADCGYRRPTRMARAQVAIAYARALHGQGARMRALRWLFAAMAAQPVGVARAALRGSLQLLRGSLEA